MYCKNVLEYYYVFFDLHIFKIFLLLLRHSIKIKQNKIIFQG